MMGPDKKTARFAGLAYLVVVLTGIFSLAYVPSQLIVSGDPARTFENITANPSLFRMGIAASIICYVAFLVLPFVLFKLLRHVNETWAYLMIIFAVPSVPITMLNLQHRFAVLALVENKALTGAASPGQLHTQVMHHLGLYGDGILVAMIFWGLWLFPLGMLIYRSGMLPRILGVLLMLGCGGYMIKVFGETLVPGFGASAIYAYVGLPAAVGEIGTCFWLLIFGVRERKG